MPYDPVEDIPNIRERGLDLRKVIPLMNGLLTTSRIALKQPYNYKGVFPYDRELSSYLQNQLLVHSTTHQSIQILLRAFVRENFYPAIVDAASLAREQIERIFCVALVTSNPHRWIRHALRGSWRSDYESYLLALEEHGQSPRFDQYLKKDFVDYLKMSQRPPYAHGEPLVSDFARKVLTYYWRNPAGRNPAWFKKKQAIRNYVAEYFEFPTPGKAVRHIQGKRLKRFLYRWHKEYSYFSQFTHQGLGKNLIPYMTLSRNVYEREKLDIIAQQLLERSVYTSFTAAASSCGIIVHKVRDSYGARAYLDEFWNQLNNTSLFARAIWNVYPRQFR